MKYTAVLLIAINLLGCATPSERFNRQAIELGFGSETISTVQFKHVLYRSNHFTDDKTLHVYLDGDGTPWVNKRWIAEDPTPRNPLILQLMKLDNSPAVLLGRPCYYGLNESSECSSKYWTSHRYSPKVVDSMVEAINNWLAQHHYTDIVLIGYSGGGSIAALMADRIQNLNKIVTVAANLNVRVWSEFHGYLTLNSSLNPAEQGQLNNSIKQFHFAGENDEIVPGFIIRGYANSQRDADYYELPGIDHACCWADEWQNILDKIDEGQ